jgi:hypothetical protein
MPSALLKLLSLADVKSVSQLTGISTRRLSGFMTGIVQPYAPTLNKFRNAYSRLAYSMLRESGAGVKMANRWKQASAPKIFDMVNTLDKTVWNTALAKGVEPDTVRWGMSQTDFDIEDWEVYVPESVKAALEEEERERKRKALR